MKLLILKTNIHTKTHRNSLRNLFNSNPNIISWTVDLEDVDKVLRMEVLPPIDENHITSLLHQQGFFGEDLKE